MPTSKPPSVKPPALTQPASASGSVPLFVFGSLMDPDILVRVLGEHRLSGERVSGKDQAACVWLEPAVLHGYRRRQAREDVFPILVSAPRGVVGTQPEHELPLVEGALIHGLTADDLDRIEYYEGAGYVLRPLTVETGCGQGERRRTCAQVFLSTGLFSDSGVAWDLGHWQQTAKRYALLLTEALMAHHGTVAKEDMEGPRWAAIEARCRALLEDEEETAQSFAG